MEIPFTKPQFTELDKQSVINTLESGWVTQGPMVKEFEKLWSEFTGIKESVAVTSCTTALQLSLHTLGIKPGDEVIVPSFTWVATANCVELLGAKPVFCDIDLNTYNIDADKIEEKVTARTKAIIPVHLFGMPADMAKVFYIAMRNNIMIIEDAACGFGSKIRGHHVGASGNAGCFSFHPKKAITTGEGGMITTNDSLLAEKLRIMRDHGASISEEQRVKGKRPYLLPDFQNAGFNFRMSDIQASLGVSQMGRADDILKQRKRIVNKYNEAFKNIGWLKLPECPSEYEHSYQSYVCLFQPKELSYYNVTSFAEMRNDFMDYLKMNGITTRPGTHAVHTLHYYMQKYNLEPLDYLNSFIADKCSVAFPVYASMTDEEQDYVIDKIIKYEVS